MKYMKQLYAPPAVLQTVFICLERDLLTPSVVKDIKPVETAGQKVDGEYNGSDSNTFNFDWNDGNSV